MGILDKVKGMIFEEGVDTPKETEAVKQQVVAVPETTKISPIITKHSSAPAINEKMAGILKDAIMKKTSAFTQFAESLDALKDIGLSEDKQYLAAYAMVSKQSVTFNDIISAIEKLHIGSLMSEKSQFEVETNNSLKEHVGSKQTSINNAVSSIQAYTQKLSELQTEIQRLESEKSALEKEIADQTQKIENSKAEFSVAYNATEQWMQECVRKIKTYLTK